MKSSYLWNYVQQLHLEENMRVKNSNDEEEEKEFEKYLLAIGQGKIPTHPEIGEYMIKIPEKIASKSEDLKTFCDEIFPNLDQRITEGLKNTLDKPDYCHDDKWIHERAIVCSQNDDVEEINKICLDMIQSNPYVYRSHDRLVN